jgi:hypothetical protein
MQESVAKKEKILLQECPICDWAKDPEFGYASEGYTVEVDGYLVQFENYEGSIYETSPDCFNFRVLCSNCDEEITDETITKMIWNLI